MNTSSLKPLLLPAALATLLSACGGSDAPPPTSAVPTLAEGAYLATVQGDSVGVGVALVNAAGKGFVLLSDDGDAGSSVMHVTDKTEGRRAPAGNGFVTLSFARSEPLTLTALTGAALAGDYQLLLDGKPVALSVATDGRISPAASSACKLSGQIDMSSNYGGGKGLTLTLENCGALAADRYDGVLFASAGTAPAKWQAVVENGKAVVDLLVYR